MLAAHEQSSKPTQTPPWVPPPLLPLYITTPDGGTTVIEGVTRKKK